MEENEMTEDKSKLGGILRYRFIAMGASGLLIVVGIILFFVLGFNTGIDFGSGYSERIQIAPVGFTVRYEGEGTAVLSVSDGVIGFTRRSAAGTEEHLLDPSEYPSSADIAAALSALGAETEVHSVLPSANAVSGFGFPATLSSEPVRVNFSTDTVDCTIEDVREALSPLGNANVQTVGADDEARTRAAAFRFLTGTAAKGEGKAKAAEDFRVAFVKAKRVGAFNDAGFAHGGNVHDALAVFFNELNEVGQLSRGDGCLRGQAAGNGGRRG